ncbi:protein FAM162B [Genypterus blacodes]|uniref:protein FAM162B n=1 Tax=Genypterus blacodes TaxID=154954 RepID=UPI003F76B532
MNFVRCRVGNLIGQVRRQVTHAQTCRTLCSKPQEAKAEPQPRAPAPAPHLGFKLPGHRPSDMDKKILVWSGRYKTAEEIPELVSFEKIDAARDKMRVKICVIMMGLSIAACIFMVFLGKKAAGRHESLTGINMEKKARWMEEVQRDKEAAAAALAAKTQ